MRKLILGLVILSSLVITGCTKSEPTITVPELEESSNQEVNNKLREMDRQLEGLDNNEDYSSGELDSL
jgi:hypothetical protein